MMTRLTPPPHPHRPPPRSSSSVTSPSPPRKDGRRRAPRSTTSRVKNCLRWSRPRFSGVLRPRPSGSTLLVIKPATSPRQALGVQTPAGPPTPFLSLPRQMSVRRWMPGVHRPTPHPHRTLRRATTFPRGPRLHPADRSSTPVSAQFRQAVLWRTCHCLRHRSPCHLPAASRGPSLFLRAPHPHLCAPPFVCLRPSLI